MRNVTKFKETKLKRKNISVSEKKVTKNVENFFLPAAQYFFLGSQNLSSIQKNLI
jgi:hypothetical protein